MKKILICIILLCALLCGCGKNATLNYFETGEPEIFQNGSSEEYAENTTEEQMNLENQDDLEENIQLSTQEESNSENTEVAEDYIQRMKRIYSEITEEAGEAADKKEILFNGLQWGFNLTEVRDNFRGTTQIVPMLKSVNFMLGIKVEFDERFSIFSNSENIGGGVLPSGEIKVAGYDVDYCILFFSAVEKDGGYVLTDKDSALYSAQYMLKPINAEAAKEDIKTKISSIYGEPDSTKEIEPYENAQTTNEYIYWYGANNTVLVLSSNDSDLITISYVWLGGEELLNAALDNAEKELLESEESVYGDGDTSGL